jgi:hypothetical protein
VTGHENFPLLTVVGVTSVFPAHDFMTYCCSFDTGVLVVTHRPMGQITMAQVRARLTVSLSESAGVWERLWVRYSSKGRHMWPTLQAVFRLVDAVL